jgi:hypothetical protein
MWFLADSAVGRWQKHQEMGEEGGKRRHAFEGYILSLSAPSLSSQLPHVLPFLGLETMEPSDHELKP